MYGRPMRKTFPPRTDLRRAREARGWTKLDVARFLKVSRAFYSFYEDGKRSASEELEGRIRKLFQMERSA